MRKNSLVALLALLLCAGIIASAVILLSGNDANSGSQTNPVKPKETFELKDEHTGEFWRRQVYGPDGSTVVEVHIAYRNGVTAHSYYNNDGKLKETREEYTATGLPKSVTVMAEDGVTVAGSQSFRADGTLEESTKLLPDGTLEEYSYFADGKTVAIHKVTETDGWKTVLLEEEFRKDGTKSSRVELLSDDRTEETSWYEDGKTIQRHRITRGTWQEVLLDEEFRSDGTPVSRTEVKPDGTEEKREYYPSGKLLIEQIEKAGEPNLTTFYREDGSVQLKSKIGAGFDEADYYDSTGTLVQHREWSWDRGQKVIVYRPDGKIHYQQEWDHERDPNNWWGPGRLILSEVSQHRADGTLAVHYRYAYGGQRLSEVTTFAADGAKRVRVQSFRSDGTVERVDFFGADGTTVVSKKYYRRNGSAEKEEQLDPTSGRLKTVKAFRADGSVERIESYDGSGKKNAIGYFASDGSFQKEELLDQNGAVTSTDTTPRPDKQAAEPAVVPDKPSAQLTQPLDYLDPHSSK